MTTQTQHRVQRFCSGSGSVEIHHADSAALAESQWPTPVAIVSDGAYGVKGFAGDPGTARSLPAWYAPHVEVWSRRAASYTTLWFWGTELSWVTVHPLLKANGWDYVACNVWNKGLAHIAGNSNTKNMRRFPQVTEVCVQYVRQPTIIVSDRETSLKQWLRDEWRRGGLKFRDANAACGVRNAATRKYLAIDGAWYMPPPDAFNRLVEYANANGDPDGRPYFSVDGENAANWDELVALKGQEVCRAKFNGVAGVTNVWNQPAVRGKERVKHDGKAYHGNQKPVRLIERILRASTDAGDVVWEPFGGMCTVAAAAINSDRVCYSAEIDERYFDAACGRLARLVQSPMMNI